jgi:choline kinase
VNGDGLYHPRIFALALSHAEDDFLVLDTRKVLGDEEMKVRYRDGALAAIAKTLPAGASDGEYIGMARFAEETFRRVREVAAEMVAQGETGSWYESAIGRVAAERRIGMLDTGGLPWTEVDDHDDLAEAAALAAWGAGAGGR